MEHIKVDMQLQ